MNGFSVARKAAAYLPTFAVYLAVAAMIFMAEEVRDAFVEGLKLSVCTVLPSVFPFVVISDFMSSKVRCSKAPFAAHMKGALKMNGAALSIFSLGLVCGFPVSARSASAAYSTGGIDKRECERLCAVASNPSVAFVISTVGALIGSPRVGVILYPCVVLSAIAVAVLNRPREIKIDKTEHITRQNFNFTASIKTAGASCITVSSFVIAFSLLLSLLKSAIKSPLLIGLLSSVLEIGNAAATLCSLPFCLHKKICLIAFSLGFSGVCALMQIYSFLPPEISRPRIFLLKLEQGFFAALLALAASYFI